MLQTPSLALTTILLLILTEFSLSTPSHSNTAGVTECQDGLKDLLDSLGSSQGIACDAVRVDLEELLTSCRPSDPVRMAALLRTILTTHYYPGACDNTGCDKTLNCLQPIIGHSAVEFRCESRFLQLSLRCLEMSVPKCAIADILRFTLRSSANQICGGPKCLAKEGIFETVAGSDCHKYMWQDRLTGELFPTFDVAPGTMFSSDTCNLAKDLSQPCYN